MATKKSVWERLTWPQVVAFGVVVAGVAAVWIAVPADKLPPWEVIGGLVSVLLGGSASALLPGLVRKDGES